MKPARIAAHTAARLPRRLLRRMVGDPIVIDDRTLDLQIQVFAEMAMKRAARSQPTVGGMREAFAELVAVAGDDPATGVAVHDRSIPGPAAETSVRIYHPPSASGDAAAIVWFHQGGGVVGDLDTDHPLCTLLADHCGAVVISVDYRLGPEHRFPAGVDDAMASYQWVLDNAEGLGIDHSRVAIGGTSTGAALAAVVCQQRRRLGVPQPLLQVLAYGDLDPTATGGSRDTCAKCFPLTVETLEFFAANYLPGLSAISDHRSAPGTATELWGLAPAVIVTAGFDPLRDAGDAYADALATAGIEVRYRCEDSLPHSFTCMGGISREARRATTRLADDVADGLR